MVAILLRGPQVEALRVSSSEGFVERVQAHLRAFFPAECERLGSAAALREVVRHGLGRARGHGLRSQREACKYLDLMFAFGRDFDRDPRLGWVAPILEGHTHDLTRSTVDRLFEQALRHPEQATGLGTALPPEAQHVEEAPP